ncbi:MAG: 1-acyl-sn-glycerol-3-phosphate acyltransferase [Sterolibacteriaceae bacterium]|uniref:1-acyl-sn-glycerol-3-phosphate acyltransferase n=1 Tax=Candidatus Methylophosphatis roskildensis TaxID=2899263 RepID=A0A9D7HKP2_9PROT|nr:1-acyl-sn-glycerol-3-phosphate acyltransferase [Candidatus Methylophosphatis roskildensis]MBK7234092.1 1-acyl-sn-glycerol-3-phosphate acyltransferase [Sterolibacteriaceae bacterium]
MLESLVASAICGVARAVTGARALWRGCAPQPVQRVYFGNHSSHADFVLIWSSLPPTLRRQTRPVAGADYWDRGGLRGYIIHRVFRGVLVDRERAERSADPIEVMVGALDQGASLIVFPEGTRNPQEGLLPFKSGIFRIAEARPGVEFVPVWLDNLKRVMPKGRLLPLPILCTVSFGTPLRLQAGETRESFLARTRDALQGLAPQENPA